MRVFSRLREWLRAKYIPAFDLDLVPPSDSGFDRFELLLERLASAGVASSNDLEGCSPAEIEQLKSRFSVTLPATYRWYLTTMGKRSGRLFTHDHMAVYYPHVLRMTAEYREETADFPNDTSVDLPVDALIIAGRLGDQFQFIRCNNLEDSPVWYFNVLDNQIAESNPSIIFWLHSFCDQAEQAIKNGYFDAYPNGTSP